MADCSVVGIGGASSRGFIKLGGLTKVYLKNLSFYELSASTCFAVYSEIGSQAIMVSGACISNKPLYDVSEIGGSIQIEANFIDYFIV
jgi:hypothetical protein